MKKLSEHHQLDPRKSGRLNYPEPYLQDAAKTADDLRARFPEAPAETEIMLIGRQGDNYEKDGVKYTHMAFLLRYPSGEMEVCHLINDYSCNKSTIRVNSLEEFFSDGLYKFDHAVWGLDKNRQEGLLKLLYSDLEILHQPKYSAIPSPAMTNYQNCNQWALEMLTAASHPDLLAAPSLEERRAAMQRQLHDEGYKPAIKNLNLLTQPLVPLAAPYVKLDDHTKTERLQGKLRFSSVKSVVDHLAAEPLLQQEYPGPTIAADLHKAPSFMEQMSAKLSKKSSGRSSL